MTAPNPKAGRGPCPQCGARILFRNSTGGKLTWKCDDCDHSGYAEKGGKAYLALLATIDAPAAPVPAAPRGDLPPKPAGAGDTGNKLGRVNSVFALGDLT